MSKIYGIDLGTTNSIIGCNGKLSTGLVSSTVNIATHKQVGRNEYGDDIISSYKTDMTLGLEGKIPITCSSIVLRKLKEIVKEENGDDVKDVIISVPAYFNSSQRKAVYKSAELAGMSIRMLVNEPTAAAIYSCNSYKDLVLVYDLGGGTFDITLIDARSGNYGVIATDGKVLGGKDLDEYIKFYILKKYKVRIMYKSVSNIKRLLIDVRDARETLSKKDIPFIEMDLSYLGIGTITYNVDEYIEALHNVFDETIVMVNDIIGKYTYDYDKPKIIYTGGMTYCPYLLSILYDTIDLEPLQYDVSNDLLVAHGVSYIASMYEDGTLTEIVQDVVKRICIEDADGKTITVIEDNSFTPTQGEVVVSNKIEADKLELSIYQGNRIMASANEYIGKMIYEFDEVKKAGDGIVTVIINVSYDGIITLKAKELLDDDEYYQSMEFHINNSNE